MPLTNSVKLVLCELSQMQNKSKCSRKKALLLGCHSVSYRDLIHKFEETLKFKSLSGI